MYLMIRYHIMGFNSCLHKINAKRGVPSTMGGPKGVDYVQSRDPGKAL